MQWGAPQSTKTVRLCVADTNTHTHTHLSDGELKSWAVQSSRTVTVLLWPEWSFINLKIAAAKREPEERVESTHKNNNRTNWHTYIIIYDLEFIFESRCKSQVPLMTAHSLRPHSPKRERDLLCDIIGSFFPIKVHSAIRERMKRREKKNRKENKLECNCISNICSQILDSQ